MEDEGKTALKVLAPAWGYSKCVRNATAAAVITRYDGMYVKAMGLCVFYSPFIISMVIFFPLSITYHIKPSPNSNHHLYIGLKSINFFYLHWFSLFQLTIISQMDCSNHLLAGFTASFLHLFQFVFINGDFWWAEL